MPYINENNEDFRRCEKDLMLNKGKIK